VLEFIPTDADPSEVDAFIKMMRELRAQSAPRTNGG
jgi:hypothetical protein